MGCACAKLRVREPDRIGLAVADAHDYAFAAGEYTRMVVVDMPDYEGDYDVVPSMAAQVLATRNRAMRADVEIHGIPYAAVDNESGGKTATIG